MDAEVLTISCQKLSRSENRYPKLLTNYNHCCRSAVFLWTSLPYNWDQSNPKRLERIDYRPIEEGFSSATATHPKSMLFWTYFDSIKASSPWKWWWFAACDSLRDLNNRTNNHELRFCGLRNRMNHWSSQSSELSTVHYQKRTKQSPSSKWFCVRMSPTSQKLFPDRSHNWTQTVWWWQCAFSRPLERLRRS